MVLRAYYGIGAAKNYFEGCSTGGRQGLILAQRFPNDFDGITVGAPVLNFTGTMVRFVQVAKALKDAPRSARRNCPRWRPRSTRSATRWTASRTASSTIRAGATSNRHATCRSARPGADRAGLLHRGADRRARRDLRRT